MNILKTTYYSKSAVNSPENTQFTVDVVEKIICESHISTKLFNYVYSTNNIIEGLEPL